MNIVQASRESFLCFCQTITPTFQVAKHHEIISKALRPIIKGESKRLLFSLPPRHGKTFMTTQHFPAWFLGHFPEKNVISTAYNQSLAEDFGIFVKNMMISDKYQEIFPHVTLDVSSKSRKRFHIKDGGNYYAVGRGGPITGRGGDLIIIDDLIKDDSEARSETYRKSMIEWWKNTLFTRLMPNASIIAVMTRWHEDDLIGYLLKNSKEPWEYVKIPAISNDNEALWPERYSIDTLLSIKKEMGVKAFQGLYQQEPMADEGYIIKKDWIQRYSEAQKPKVFEKFIMSFDLTFKGNTSSDFVVGQYWGKVKSDFYLIDMIRGQWDFTETLSKMKAFFVKYPDSTNIVIEDAANASAVYSTIKEKVSGVRLWKPQTSKEARLSAISPLFEAKNVYIPENDKYDIVVGELLGFPNASHDDTVDACTMALLNLKKQDAGIFMSMGERIF